MKTKCLMLLTVLYITLFEVLIAQSPIWIAGSNTVQFTSFGPTAQPLPIPTFTQFQQRFGTGATQQMYDDNMQSPWPRLFYNGGQTHSANQAIANEDGLLQFFIIDENIYDCEGFCIGYLNQDDAHGGGVGSTNDKTLGSEFLIVPDPQDCSRYYIFFTFTDFEGYPLWVNDYAPHYAILDLSKPAPGLFNNSSVENTMLALHSTGSTLHHFASILPDYPITMGGELSAMGNVNYAALKSTNGSGYLIFVSIGSYETQGITSVFTCLLDECGLSYTGNYFEFDDAPSFGLGYGGIIRTQLEAYRISNGNIRIGLAMGGKLFTNQLNSSGQTIANQINSFVLSNTVDPNPPIIKGLEFFGDNHLYYLNTDHSSILSVFNYIDFTNIQNGPQPIFGISTINDFQYSMIESDGSSLLMVGEGSSGNGNRLGRWTIPDDPSNSTFVDNYIDFSQYPIPISNYSEQAVLYGSSGSGGSVNADGHFTKLYHLPDQIDGYNYQSRFEENMSCCIANKEFTFGTFKATSAQDEWSNGTSNNPFNVSNNIITIAEELRIPTNQALKITGMELRFAKGARIVVENGFYGETGGTLELVDCFLTNDSRCGDVLWQGIEVWGDPNFWQGGSNNGVHPQGTLIMSGTTIENACRAVLTGKTTNSVTDFDQFEPFGQPECSDLEFSKTIGCDICPNIQSGFGGGIVLASEVVFENNVTDVEMRDYISNSQQYPNSNPAVVLVPEKSKFERCQFYTTDFLNELNQVSEQHVLLSKVFIPTFKGCHFKNFMSDQNLSIEERGVGISCSNASCRVVPYGNLEDEINETNATIFSDLHIGVQTTSWNTAQPSFIYKSIFDNNKHGVFGFGVGSLDLVKNSFQVRNEALENYNTTGTFLFGCNNYRIEENFYFTSPNSAPWNSTSNTYGTVITNSGENNNEVYKNSYTELAFGAQFQGINGQEHNNDVLANSGTRWLCNYERPQSILDADLSITSGRMAVNQGFCPSNSIFNSDAGNSFSSADPALSHVAMNSNVLPVWYYYVDENEPTVSLPPSNQFNLVSCGTTPTNSCRSKAHPIYGWSVKPQKRERLDDIGRAISDLEDLLIIDSMNSLDILADIAHLEAEHESVIREMISDLFSDDSLSNYLDEYLEILELGRTVYHKMMLADILVSVGDSSNLTNLISDLQSLAPNRAFYKILSIQKVLMAQENPLEYARQNLSIVEVLWEIALDEDDPVNKERAEVLLNAIVGEPLNFGIEFLGKMSSSSQIGNNENEVEEKPFTLYPNPSDGLLFVTSALEFNDGQMHILSSNGLPLFSTALKMGTNRINIGASHDKLSTGVYIVIFQTDQGVVQHEKLIIR